MCATQRYMSVPEIFRFKVGFLRAEIISPKVKKHRYQSNLKTKNQQCLTKKALFSPHLGLFDLFHFNFIED